MRRRFWLIALAALVLAILVPYVAFDREDRVLDASARRERGGSYVTLPAGVTHYELSGPQDGAPLVLVHGGTVPLFVWDGQVPALNEAGFRVLRYDHFGRGYSDRPEVDYDRALYEQQLDDLLDALEIEGPIHLMGVSFGGATAASYAAAHPGRVAKLILVAPVVDYAEGKALFGLARVPVFSEWYARVFAVRKTIDRASDFFQGLGAPSSYGTRFDEQTRFEGYEQALLSMSRTDALTSYRDVYASLGEQQTLLLWGTDDAEIPREHMELVRRSVPSSKLVEFQGAGHGLLLQRADEVNREILAFLSER